MMLITVLVCLIVQRYVAFGPTIHSVQWFDRYVYSFYSTFGKTSIWQGWIGLILIIAPFVIIVGLVDYFLHGWWFNVFAFLFGVIILFYCLDAHSLKKQLAEYFAAYKSGNEIAAMRAGRMLAPEISLQSLSYAARAVTRAIFLQADERIFGVLFWYLLLGPTGALLYFLSAQIVRSAKEGNVYLEQLLPPAERWFAILNWLPVRVTGLIYALAGHFNYAFSHWLASLKLNLSASRELAVNVGLEALEMDVVDASHADLEENTMALALVDRSIIIWVVIIAIFTLGALLP